MQRLSQCQADAANGLYAAAMAGFVRWLADRYDQVQATLRAQINELRQKAARSGMHRRTPDSVASIAIGLKYLLAFAQDSGAIDKSQADVLWQRGWLALGQVATKQDAYHKASEPTRRFVELLLSALASGHAHIADRDGRPPREAPEAWGWRRRITGNVLNEDSNWQPEGDRVGWIDDETIYLDPDSSYRVANAMAAGSADGLGITAQTLRKRLHERGLLVTENSRESVTVRRKLEGQTRAVLQLSVGALIPQAPDILDIPDNDMALQGPECQVCQVSPWVDPHDRQVEIEERAAVLEYDGGLPREQAEVEARLLAQEQQKL